MPNMLIPQSTAVRVPLKAYLTSDHVSKAVSKTIAVVISKNGGAFGNPDAGATNASEFGGAGNGLGWYYVDLDATDTATLGPLIVRGTEGTIDDAEACYRIVNPHNSGFDGVPNYAAGAVNGLPLAVDTSGRVDVLKVNGTSQTARDIGASVLLSAGTGTGQLDFTSGVVKSSLVQILGTALTETAGQIAAAFKKFFNVATPTGTVNSIPDAVAGATNGLAIVGSVMGKSPATLASTDVTGNLPADVQTIKTAAVTCAAPVTVLASVGTAATDTAQTGDAYSIVNDVNFGNAKLVRSTTPANTLTVDTSHQALSLVNAYATGQAPLQPATAGRTLVVDAAGLADANAVKVGPSGSGTAQTARDLGGALPSASPGAANGLTICGSNAATTFATLTSTGAFSINGTNDVAQTGDSFARIGAAGTGLTALGDTRLANLDAAISTRTKPADTQAAVTTVTNLTNAPTVGDLTASMKTSVENAVLNATASSHNASGSIGQKINSAAAAGDPMSAAVPGAYPAGSAGYVIGTNLDAKVSSAGGGGTGGGGSVG